MENINDIYFKNNDIEYIVNNIDSILYSYHISLNSEIPIDKLISVNQIKFLTKLIQNHNNTSHLINIILTLIKSNSSISLDYILKYINSEISSKNLIDFTFIYRLNIEIENILNNYTPSFYTILSLISYADDCKVNTDRLNIQLFYFCIINSYNIISNNIINTNISIKLDLMDKIQTNYNNIDKQFVIELISRYNNNKINVDEKMLFIISLFISDESYIYEVFNITKYGFTNIYDIILLMLYLKYKDDTIVFYINKIYFYDYTTEKCYKLLNILLENKRYNIIKNLIQNFYIYRFDIIFYLNNHNINTEYFME